jgi:hypothetical protein
VALPPCEAGGSGLRQGHTRRAHGASARFARLPRFAITRGDATRHVTGRDTSSSRASLRSALVFDRSQPASQLARSGANDAGCPLLLALAWAARDFAEGGAQRSLSVGRRSRWSFRVALPPCEAGGSGLRQEHTRRAHGASARFAPVPRVAITRGDATRHVTGRDTSSSRASLRSALGLLARALIGSRTTRHLPRSLGVTLQRSSGVAGPKRTRTLRANKSRRKQGPGMKICENDLESEARSLKHEA